MQAIKEDSAVLLKLMSATSLRGRTLAANIANQNTPGYQRREVRFEELLASRLERGRDPAGVAPEVAVDEAAAPRADGNTVHMEDEVVAMRQNRILYELYASILRGRTNLVRSAIHGER